MSDVNLVEVFVDPTGPEIIEVMSPGPPGVQGPAGSGGLSPIAPNTLLGNNTGNTAIPSGLTDTQIKTLLGLATTDSPSFAGLQLFDTTNADYGNVYLEDNYYDFRNFENDLASIRANTIEAQEVFIAGLQSFTGTSTPGLQLKSLTTAQINTLASASALPVGSILVDSTTDRIDARLARGTVELIDSAGGQVIAGNLAATTLMVGGASGPLLRNNGGTVGVRNNANSADGPFACSSIAATGDATFSGGGTTQIACNGIRRQANNSTFTILGSGAAATGTFTSITLSPLADGSLAQTSGNFRIVAITPTYNQATGTAANTDFLINRTETAVGSGAQLFADFQVGGSSRFSVSNTGNLTASGTVRLGNFTVGTLPSAAANERATGYVIDSSVSTYGSVVAGGGSTPVIVLSNGTNWVVSGGGTSGLGSFTKAQLDTAVSDGNVLYVGDAPTAHVHAGTDITTGTVDPARLGSGSSITTKFLRGDSTWQTISGGGDALVANSLDQFADVTQTAGQTLSITSSTTLSGGTHSGTNTGDNAVNSLYSGLVSNATHTGDVTGDTALTIANGAVTLAKTTGIQKTITSGTAVPSGGVDGDIYLQYT